MPLFTEIEKMIVLVYAEEVNNTPPKHLQKKTIEVYANHFVLFGSCIIHF